MKRLTVVLLSVVFAVVLTSAVFGAGKPASPPPPPPPFVEANVPDGKALIYIYSKGFLLNSWNGNAGLLVLSESGPIGILHSAGYHTYIVEPGSIKLWIVGAQAYAAGLTLEAVAGQIYYVEGTGVPDIKLIPNEKGKTEIAGCKETTD